MELVARQVVEGFLTGRHRSPYHGFSVEYLDHRAYTPGDEIAHARLEDPGPHRQVLRQAVRGRDQPPGLHPARLLEVDGLQERRGSTKLDYGSYLAAALTYLMLHQNDAVGLVLFDTEVRQYLPPKARPTQFRRILDLLEHSTARERHRRRRRPARDRRAHPAPRAGHPHQRPDRRRGQDRQRPAALPPQPPRGHRLPRHGRRRADLPVRPADALQGHGRAPAGWWPTRRACATRYLARINTFIDGSRPACFERNISYNLANTKEPYDQFLAAYLEKRARLG